MTPALKGASVVLALLLTACDIQQPVERTPKQECTVAAKIQAIENRFSRTDFLFGGGSITKSRSVFYLIASNGKKAEVPPEKWALAKEGDPMECPETRP